MSPVRPEELSALLDGELTPERADAVRRQLNVDPALAEELQTLARFDARWRVLATAASFEPRVDLPQRDRFERWAIAPAAAIALAGLRLAIKFLDSMVFGVTLDVLALVVLLSALIWILSDGLYPDSELIEGESELKDGHASG